MTALVGLLLGAAAPGGLLPCHRAPRARHQGAAHGDYGPVNEESIRFRHDPSLTFATSDVSSIKARPRRAGETGDGPDEPVYEITTTFLGLTGTVSPLPTYMAEEVLHEDHDRPAQREFLDVFHHRIISLFYRAHARTPSPPTT
jgi:type VI secretion system protein ImpH